MYEIWMYMNTVNGKSLHNSEIFLQIFFDPVFLNTCNAYICILNETRRKLSILHVHVFCNYSNYDILSHLFSDFRCLVLWKIWIYFQSVIWFILIRNAIPCCRTVAIRIKVAIVLVLCTIVVYIKITNLKFKKKTLGNTQLIFKEI